MSIQEQVEAARTGTDPALICQVPSGWVVLCNMQFLSGYCILMPDPVVQSINDLEHEKREIYLSDMAIVGDALLEVTDAYRINYAITGNLDQALHAHIVPRFLSEEKTLREGLPWSYPQSTIDEIRFDPERDQKLMQKLSVAIQQRTKKH